MIRYQYDYETLKISKITKESLNDPLSFKSMIKSNDNFMDHGQGIVYDLMTNAIFLAKDFLDNRRLSIKSFKRDSVLISDNQVWFDDSILEFEEIQQDKNPMLNFLATLMLEKEFGIFLKSKGG